MKRPILVAAAAAIYLMAAWVVAPGFYDGFTPPQPYNWTSPPPQAAPGNLPPRSGHLDIKVIGGVSDASSLFTDDGCPLNCSPQMVVGFLPGAFDATGKTSISVDVKPVSTFPTPTGIHFATNVYQITANAPLVKDANVELRYSDLVPAPSFIYLAVDANGPWKSIGGAESQIYIIQTTTRQPGYFAAGYPGSATRGASSGSSSQLLPIAVAVLILGVLVAGVPLAMVRRRRAAGEVGDAEVEDAEEDDEA